jgi:ferritin
MRISKPLNAAVNAQIGRELSSSHLYLSIAAYFDDRALKKLAGFFYQQSDEERAHALKFLQYLTSVDGVVVNPEVVAPQAKFATHEEAINKA